MIQDPPRGAISFTMGKQRRRRYPPSRIIALCCIALAYSQRGSHGFPVHSARVRHGQTRHAMTTTSTVETVKGPLTPSLLASSWGRKPLLIQSAFEIESTSWPTWEEVLLLACEEGAESRFIRHCPGDLESFTLDVGPFDDLQHLMNRKEKWTLVVNDVDRFHPPLSDWIDSTFGFIPRWRRDDGQVRN